MIFAETVVAGAPNPGTEPEVLCTAAGYYIGYRDSDGLPYSRETEYFASEDTAQDNLVLFKSAMADSIVQAQQLAFVRR
jgi:hypothetical protein